MNVGIMTVGILIVTPTHLPQHARLLVQRTICLQDITDFAVHFFRIRRAIRYALGANLGKDQTVMLDW